jgi:hypothetical protein
MGRIQNKLRSKTFSFAFCFPLPEPGPVREKARALTEGREADKFASAPRRTEKGGGLGAAFLAYFLSLLTRSRAGSGVAGPGVYIYYFIFLSNQFPIVLLCFFNLISNSQTENFF